MNKPVPPARRPPELARPQIRLSGDMNDQMLREFLEGLSAAEQGSGPVVLELTTNGGDADVGRRIATDIRLFRERTGRPAVFIGKAVVYSAGVSVMAAFPREDRWLARGTTLLIHCRSFNRSMNLAGPLVLERARVEALLAEIDTGIRAEEASFRDLIAGGDVSLNELLERAESGWYVEADEALRRGLIGGVV